MAMKRLTLELPQEQYDFLQKEANLSDTTISGLLRKFIETQRYMIPKPVLKDFSNDSFAQRSGSFNGPPNLSENHDQDLYSS